MSTGITSWTYIVGITMACLVVVPVLLVFFQREPPPSTEQKGPKTGKSPDSKDSGS